VNFGTEPFMDWFLFALKWLFKGFVEKNTYKAYFRQCVFFSSPGRSENSPH